MPSGGTWPGSRWSETPAVPPGSRTACKDVLSAGESSRKRVAGSPSTRSPLPPILLSEQQWGRGAGRRAAPYSQEPRNPAPSRAGLLSGAMNGGNGAPGHMGGSLLTVSSNRSLQVPSTCTQTCRALSRSHALAEVSQPFRTWSGVHLSRNRNLSLPEIPLPPSLAPSRRGPQHHQALALQPSPPHSLQPPLP